MDTVASRSSEEAAARRSGEHDGAGERSFVLEGAAGRRAGMAESSVWAGRLPPLRSLFLVLLLSSFAHRSLRTSERKDTPPHPDAAPSRSSEKNVARRGPRPDARACVQTWRRAGADTAGNSTHVLEADGALSVSYHAVAQGRESLTLLARIPLRLSLPTKRPCARYETRRYKKKVCPERPPRAPRRAKDGIETTPRRDPQGTATATALHIAIQAVLGDAWDGDRDGRGTSRKARGREGEADGRKDEQMGDGCDGSTEKAEAGSAPEQITSLAHLNASRNLKARKMTGSIQVQCRLTRKVGPHRRPIVGLTERFSDASWRRAICASSLISRVYAEDEAARFLRQPCLFAYILVMSRCTGKPATA
ncbi:hypothetical protein K438DRAFT_2122999 [Mycena galopus ATCC 62051]|nr:hypothetical protein K438DRAFT_2122999 [Mycena galopus ATCC 62051]